MSTVDEFQKIVDQIMAKVCSSSKIGKGKTSGGLSISGKNLPSRFAMKMEFPRSRGLLIA